MLNRIKNFAVVSAAIFAMVAGPASAQLVVNPSTIGQRVVVANTGDVIATFLSSNAGFSDTLFLNGRTAAIFNNQTSSIGDTVNLGTFNAGTELVFRLVTPETVSALAPLAPNYFTGPASRNPDGVAHAAVNSVGSTSYVGFEDLYGGGDRDYNDLVFSFTNTAAVTAAVPEAATWAMMMVGLGVVGGSLRRRQKVSTRVQFA